MADFKIFIFRFTQSALLLALLSNAMAQGPAWEWARTVNTNDDEHVNDVVVDKSNNDVYIVGQWERDLSSTFPTGANPSTDFTDPFGDIDGFVAKYDSAGNVIWSFKVGGPNDDIVKAIAIDPEREAGIEKVPFDERNPLPLLFRIDSQKSISALSALHKANSGGCILQVEGAAIPVIERKPRLRFSESL